MLDCPEKTGTGVPVASLEVGRTRRLFLEPLYAAHVDGLQCFLGVSCAPAHTAYVCPRPSGTGSNVSRTRTRGVRGMCERCAGLHDGTFLGFRSALYVSMSIAARVLKLA